MPSGSIRLSPDHFWLLGAELEFFLLCDGENIGDPESGSYPEKPYSVKPRFAAELSKYRDELAGRGLILQDERGLGQFEISFGPEHDPVILAGKISAFKENSSIAGLQADFRAKPMEFQPGNGLHIHLSLNAPDGNAFSENPALLEKAIAGMLHKLPESMPVFAPAEESRKRFVPGFGAPTKICWGGNNRTTAIRIPGDSANLRIEHRVPGSDADPMATIQAIINAASYGINNDLSPGEKIYGNAHDNQYNRPWITAYG